MNILGIETSDRRLGVGVRTDAGAYEIEGAQDLNHSVSLLADCRDAAAKAGITIRDLDRIAVGLGPGSFTGIRIGVTAAKSLAWSLEIPVAGICTLQALAASLFAGNTVAPDGKLLVIADARVKEFFVGSYHLADEGVVQDELTIVGLENIADMAGPGTAIAGPALRRHGEVLRETAGKARVLDAGFAPPPTFIISEAERCSDFRHMPEDGLEPLYLKPSEAERQSPV